MTLRTILTTFVALLACGAFAAHTDAPPGRYDYTAKVAAAGAAGKAAATKSNEPEEALALADRTYAYVAKTLGEAALKDEKAELEADRTWLAAAKTERERKTVEKEIRRLRRHILFRHPDLQFKKLLAVQRGIPYSRENHMVDQYLGRWSRPGPGLVVLENWQTAPKKSSLLGDKLPTGTVINPDLHWNADRILFSFCDHTAKPPADAQKLKVPEVIVRDDPWVKKVDPAHPIYGPGYKAGGERAVAHRRYFIYECAADGSWVRQVTGCPGDPMETQGGRQTAMIEDIDPCYLPDGGFVFSSTRGQNYGRCHWGRYVPSFLLYRADAGGKNIRQISFGEANEWEPAVMNDGRIAYTRWDYINRHAVWFQSLWATRPDGTAVSHVYGNYSEDIGVVTETKAIPGSRLLLCTASAHHNITSGSLFLLDPSVGEDGLKPVTRVTPEVPFPESEGWNTPGAYCSPFPVNDTLFLCSYSDETLGYPDYHPRHRREEYMAAWPSPAAFGIWLVDTLGGRELIYQDPEISTFNPIPLVKRPMPPALVSTLPPPDKAPDTGLCYVENVYDCRSELPKDSIKCLRINKLDVMGACRRETLNQHDDLDLHKELLGTVPVAADGSAQFRIPAGVPIQLQAVDTNGVAVFTMRSFIYAQKGEVQGCTGCHENKFKSGAAKYAVQSPAGRTTYDPKPEVDLGYTPRLHGSVQLHEERAADLRQALHFLPRARRGAASRVLARRHERRLQPHQAQADLVRGELPRDARVEALRLLRGGESALEEGEARTRRREALQGRAPDARALDGPQRDGVHRGRRLLVEPSGVARGRSGRRGGAARGREGGPGREGRGAAVRRAREPRHGGAEPRAVAREARGPRPLPDARQGVAQAEARA